MSSWNPPNSGHLLGHWLTLVNKWNKLSLFITFWGFPTQWLGIPVALSKKRSSTCHLVHGDRNPLEGPDISNEDLFFLQTSGSKKHHLPFQQSKLRNSPNLNSPKKNRQHRAQLAATLPSGHSHFLDQPWLEVETTWHPVTDGDGSGSSASRD